jgi:hypothetical protein
MLRIMCLKICQNNQLIMKYLLKITGFTSIALFVAMMGTQPLAVLADQACSPTTTSIVSDTTNVADSTGFAFIAYNGSPFWTTVPGAEWIWKSFFAENPAVSDSATFSKNFTIDGAVDSSSLTIAADDYYTVLINGTQVASEFGEGNFITAKTFSPDVSLFHSGTNIIQVEVTNAPYYYPTQATSYTNPAGVAYALTINSESCSSSASGTTGSSHGISGDTIHPIFNQSINNSDQNGLTTSTTTGSKYIIPIQEKKSVNAINATDSTSASITNIANDYVPTSTSVISTPGSNMLVAAVGNLPAGLFGNFEYILVALILVVIFYIVWKLLLDNKTGQGYKGIRAKDLVYFVGLTVVSSGILYFLSYSYAITPLAFFTVLLLIGIYLGLL